MPPSMVVVVRALHHNPINRKIRRLDVTLRIGYVILIMQNL
jgi:hypothetical protein